MRKKLKRGQLIGKYKILKVIVSRVVGNAPDYRSYCVLNGLGD